VLIYEMVAGYPPFYHEDRVQMFKNICHVKFSFPSSFGKAREGRAAPALSVERRISVCNAAARGSTCWPHMPMCACAAKWLLTVKMTVRVLG
jgi:hypothetical protein